MCFLLTSHRCKLPDRHGPTKTGSIVRWNPDKGYGFIKPDRSGDNVFVHISQICVEVKAHICQGMNVSYQTQFDRLKNKNTAENVRLIQAEFADRKEDPSSETKGTYERRYRARRFDQEPKRGQYRLMALSSIRCISKRKFHTYTQHSKNNVPFLFMMHTCAVQGHAPTKKHNHYRSMNYEQTNTSNRSNVDYDKPTSHRDYEQNNMFFQEDYWSFLNLPIIHTFGSFTLFLLRNI